MRQSDGTDAVMLSGETANGAYFKDAIKTMARTTSEAENSRNYNALYQSVRNSVINEYGRLSSAESLASSAVKVCCITLVRSLSHNIYKKGHKLRMLK